MLKDKKNFDVYIGIDWSGAKSPIKNSSVALSWCFTGCGKPEFLSCKLSRQDVADWLISFSEQGKSMLIGVDCNFGYAEIIATKQFNKNFKVNDLWSEVEKYNHENENLYAGGFWESEKYSQYFWTEGTKPDWFDENKLRRQTEKSCKEYSFGVPECPFKLIGPKQVGKGGLSGMRLINYLNNALGKKISVWPFQDSSMTPSIILAEIYPRLFLNYCGFKNKKIRDLDDLNFILRFLKSEEVKISQNLNDHMCDAIISAAGLRFFIEQLSSSVADALHLDKKYTSISKSEGWIFGVNKKFIKGEI